MGRAKKVVLAYSGGVDTSVCIPYLKEEWAVEEVITFAADLGQGDELEPIRQKALDAGASQSLVGDLIKPFIEEFAFRRSGLMLSTRGVTPYPLLSPGRSLLVDWWKWPGRLAPMPWPMAVPVRATIRCVLMWPSHPWLRI